MDWGRTLLDGFVLGGLFLAAVTVIWLLHPHAFYRMFPKELKEAAAPYSKEELVACAVPLYSLYLLMFAYLVASAKLAGIEGFWGLFWHAYVCMIIMNFFDLIGLDWWLLQKGLRTPWMRDRLVWPGTEECRSWDTGVWMRTLALPEHLLLWPLVTCPITGLLCAGVGILL